MKREDSLRALTTLVCIVLISSATVGAKPQSALSPNSEISDQPRPLASPPGKYSGDIRAARLGQAEVLDNYVIGPGDLLAISVWKDAELSRTMPVRPDGKISMPVIGEMQASGLTAVELQTQIIDKLGSYMRNPQVNVVVQEIKSRTFNVVGKVTKAGSFDLTKPITVLDAIALAGGFQEFARVTKVYVLRRSSSGSQSILAFNYKRVIKGKGSEQNVQLQPGDTVVVP